MIADPFIVLPRRDRIRLPVEREREREREDEEEREEKRRIGGSRVAARLVSVTMMLLSSKWSNHRGN